VIIGGADHNFIYPLAPLAIIFESNEKATDIIDSEWFDGVFSKFLNSTISLFSTMTSMIYYF